MRLNPASATVFTICVHILNQLNCTRIRRLSSVLSNVFCCTTQAATSAQPERTKDSNHGPLQPVACGLGPPWVVRFGERIQGATRAGPRGISQILSLPTRDLQNSRSHPPLSPLHTAPNQICFVHPVKQMVKKKPFVS